MSLECSIHWDRSNRYRSPLVPRPLDLLPLASGSSFSPSAVAFELQTGSSSAAWETLLVVETLAGDLEAAFASFELYYAAL